MRLLQLSDHGKLSLTEHDDDKLPPYAILSHTWGTNGEEVTFHDIEHGLGKSKAGYAKLLFCGQQAQKDELKHFWADTCCINKDSATELSEALNSMFRWYQQATKCYVYLQDVTALKRDADGQTRCHWEAAFRKSRWFTRGWTLQELLAPKVVEFWSRDGQLLGTKETLSEMTADITGISLRALRGVSLSTFPPPERLRWAAKRETTRKEDKAYCLLGIFDVSLTPRYGESHHAFLRLQRKIDKSWNGSATLHETPAQPVDMFSRAQNRQKLMASFNFDQMDARHSSIKDAQRTTCVWILAHSAYTAWNDRNRPQRLYEILWIAGKPGAGKSTIMKFVLAQARKAKVEDDSDEIILSFFFNARGEDLEKTTLGMYRSLLAQLLNEAPDLQHVLDNVNASGLSRSQSSPLTLDVLQRLLSAAIQQLGRRRLKCFIDALDECDEQQVRNMLGFFEDLGENTLHDQRRISICFASRHYPTIDIRDGRRLVLEDELGHADDLRKYIHRRLPAKKHKLAAEIQAQVQEKANGVFMWVVLVVDILKEDFDRGRIFAVKERLHQIPTELSDLFKDLLRRDALSMNELLLCLQWILFAKRPLKPEEFYFAMSTGLRRGSSQATLWMPEPWDPERDTAEDMNLYVLSSSKGLAELTKSKKAPTVQFIHESVRDFLIKDGGLRELWPELDGQLASFSHDVLKNCCAEHLVADLSSLVDVAQPLLKASSAEAKLLRQQVSDSYPFLEYASKEVLHHSNEAAHSVNQKTFLETFALDKWIHVTNVYRIHDNRRHSPQAGLDYILVDNGYDRLIEAMQCDRVWFQYPGERYQYPIVAAFAKGHQPALRALLEDHRAAHIAGISTDPGFGKASQLRSNQDLLLWAMQDHNWSFAEFIATSYADKSLISVTSNIRKYCECLCNASYSGRETLVRLLLDYGIDVNGASVKQEDGNALYAASRGCHENIVQLLLDRGAKVNAGSGQFSKSPAIAADADLKSGSPSTALFIASFQGCENVVRLLLNHGANVNAESNIGRPLHAACLGGYEKIVQLLLERGADVNAIGGRGGTALHDACIGGYEKVVQLLLDRGADANSRGQEHDPALSAACRRGHEEVVQLLLDHGANIHTVTDVYGNALSAAYRRGHKKVVQLLLDHGANF